MARGRELSQLGSLINIEDSTKNIGVAAATPSQKVGIGTNSPTSKVEVVGDVLVSGIVTATSFVGDGSSLSGLSTFSGDYNDLTNKPSIPQSGVDFDPAGTDNSTDVTLSGSYDYLTLSSQQITLNQIDASTDISGLSNVATSGSYNDLSNTPTIPSIVGLASEGYVDVSVANLVDSAPSTLDTLNELAAALGDDANFSTTITNSLANKANLSGANFTGVVTASSFDGNLTGNADTATYASTSGISTNVIGGIASVTQLSVSGISTLGVVTAGNIYSTGIVTATSFSGSGVNLTGIVTSISSGSGISIDQSTGNVTITATGGGGGGAQVSISTEAPSSPSAGDLWYNSLLARTFIYYNDGDSSQWVDSSPFTLSVSSPVTATGGDGINPVVSGMIF